MLTRPLGYPRCPIGQHEPLKLRERGRNRGASSPGGMRSTRVPDGRRPLSRDTGLMGDDDGE